jgi:hypothetical protein
MVVPLRNDLEGNSLPSEEAPDMTDCEDRADWLLLSVKLLTLEERDDEGRNVFIRRLLWEELCGDDSRSVSGTKVDFLFLANKSHLFTGVTFPCFVICNVLGVYWWIIRIGISLTGCLVVRD